MTFCLMIMTFWYPDQKMSKIIKLRILFFASKLVSLLLCYAQCLGRCQKISFYGEIHLKGGIPYSDIIWKIYSMSIRSGIHTIFRLFFCDTVRHPTRYPDFFPVPGPVLFSRTNFFRYRYRYFFQGPIFSGTSIFSRYRYHPKKGEFPGPWQNQYHMGLF